MFSDVEVEAWRMHVRRAGAKSCLCSNVARKRNMAMVDVMDVRRRNNNVRIRSIRYESPGENFKQGVGVSKASWARQ